MAQQIVQAWQPTKEELDEILAEMGPVIRAFVKRDRALRIVATAHR